MFQGTKAVVTGGALAAGAGILLFIWPFVLGVILSPDPERVYSVCLGATGGVDMSLHDTVFPTQNYCQEGASSATYYTIWESAGLSSVFVILVLAILYGVWMAIRRDESGPQPTS
jgi:hypothetical protein